jgi:uncharacterized delta-60 repeat protein
MRTMTLIGRVALALAALLVSARVVWAHDSGFGLARYTADGALDQSFGSRGLVVTRSAQRSFVANALAVQSDGRILVAGMVSDLASASLQLAVARYNPDGSADGSFGTAGLAATPVGAAGAGASTLALQSDGRILVAGTAYAHGTTGDAFALACFTPAGQLCPGFGSDGVVSTQVGASGAAVQALALQSNGSILLAGTAFSNGPTDDDFALVRYTPDGRLDRGFGSGGIITTDFGSGEAGARPALDRAGGVAVQPDGRIVVGGSTRGDHQAFAIARYNADGSLDSTFGVGGKAQIPAAAPQVYAVIVQPAGDLVLAGTAGSLSGSSTAPFALARFRADGRPDLAFGSDGLVTASFEGSRSGARAAASQPDGKLLIGGAQFGAPSAQGEALPQSGFALTRYTTDGRIDTGFGASGRVLTTMGDAGATPLSLAVQPDGKIVAAGLVFFRVPTPAGPFDAAARIATPAAVAALLATGLALAFILRRASH